MTSFTIGVLSAVLQVLWLLGAIAVTVALIQLYLRTRLSGWVWLLMAVAVWPLLDRLLTFAWNMYLPSYAGQTGSTLEQITALNIEIMGLGSLVEIVLLVTAVLKLRSQLASLPWSPTFAAAESRR